MQVNALEKPFYAAINTSITLVRKFEITPAKWDKQRPYDFMNDKQIGRLLLCLNTLSELEIKSANSFTERLKICRRKSKTAAILN